MHWGTLFHFRTGHHGEAAAAPPPFDRVEVQESHGRRGADISDVPHAVADLLTHAMPFVAGGEPSVHPLDEEHYGDCRIWRFELRLAEGAAEVRGRPVVDGAFGDEKTVQAHAVSVQGSWEFACAVRDAFQAIKAVPGLAEHLSGQHAELGRALARAESAEQVLEEIDSRNGD